MDVTDDLRVLADKAYLDLEANAMESLALITYLGQIENAQVTFVVKQKTLETLHEAVTATVELESYLTPRMAVSSMEVPEQDEGQVSFSAVGTSVSNPHKTMFEKIVDRLDQLDSSQKQKNGDSTGEDKELPSRIEE